MKGKYVNERPKTSRHIYFRITSTVDGKYDVLHRVRYDCTAQEPTMLYVIRAPSRTDNAATTLNK